MRKYFRAEIYFTADIKNFIKNKVNLRVFSININTVVIELDYLGRIIFKFCMLTQIDSFITNYLNFILIVSFNNFS